MHRNSTAVFRARGFFIAAVFVLLQVLLASCAEKTGSGDPVSIPSVSVDCQTPQCKTSVAGAVLHVWVTTFNCDPASDNLASTATSATVDCTTGGGCTATPTQWVDEHGSSIDSVAAGTYTVCGRIDYNGDYPSVTTGDTTIEKDDVSFSSSTSAVILDSWTDN